MPVSSATWDMVTERRPCSTTSAAVVSRIASRTSRRCASTVSFQSFGTHASIGEYDTVRPYRRQNDLIATLCLVYSSAWKWRGDRGDRGARLDQAFSPGPRGGSAELQGAAGGGDRVPRSKRSRQDHHASHTAW